MLKRVFKTIFILTLSLCITLPANAGNVDVSDGSAFITKSELSYQLNALSSRMTQLENSLDSKIDKLVSSYLTRNGIWNGIKQQIGTSGSLTLRYGYNRGSSKSWPRANYSISSSGTGPNSDSTDPLLRFWEGATSTVGEIVNWNSNATYTLINKVNKSGMIVFNTQITNYRQSSLTRCCISLTTTSTSGRGHGDHFAFIYTQDFIYWINGTKEGGRTHCEFIGTAANCALRCPQVPSGSIVFFVNKDDKITIEDKPVLIKGNGSEHAQSLVWWEYSDGSYSTYDYVITDAYVY